jgi:hypothetical protein
MRERPEHPSLWQALVRRLMARLYEVAISRQ